MQDFNDGTDTTAEDPEVPEIEFVEVELGVHIDDSPATLPPDVSRFLDCYEASILPGEADVPPESPLSDMYQDWKQLH